MTYQYRTFKLSQQKEVQFNQFDLYFYKLKSTSVGIKVRFRRQQRGNPFWQADELQCKYIKNIPKIKQGIQSLEEWKKMAYPCDFKIFTLQYMHQNPQLFEGDKDTPIEKLIASELKRLNHLLVSTIKKIPIPNKHLQKNQQLSRWISEETDLIDVIIVEKSKYKSKKLEEGIVQAKSIYQLAKPQKNAVYDTKSCESKNEEQAKHQIIVAGISGQENISYPGFIEKIYFGLM